MGWHTVMEFTPSLVSCVISSGNHSLRLVRESGECAINLPTTALTDAVVGIGNTTGAEIDKFREFGLTAEQGRKVKAPLIRECHANFRWTLVSSTWLGRASPSGKASASYSHVISSTRCGDASSRRRQHASLQALACLIIRQERASRSRVSFGSAWSWPPVASH